MGHATIQMEYEVRSHLAPEHVHAAVDRLVSTGVAYQGRMANKSNSATGKTHPQAVTEGST